MRTFAIATLALGALAAATAAKADILYDNGPANEQVSGWTINFGFAVGATFDLASDSEVTGVDFIGWNGSQEVTNSVDWTIESAPDGSGVTYASGTASLSPTFVITNGFGFDIYQYNFGIAPLDLAAGSYWLVLDNAVTNDGNPAYWDINGGPSQGWENSIGYLTSDACNENIGVSACSTTFDIIGTAAAPEPMTITIFGTAIAGLGAARRSKRAE